MLNDVKQICNKYLFQINRIEIYNILKNIDNWKSYWIIIMNNNITYNEYLHFIEYYSIDDGIQIIKSEVQEEYFRLVFNDDYYLKFVNWYKNKFNTNLIY